MLKICDVAVTIRFVMVRHRKPYSVFLVKYGLLCSKAGKGRLLLLGRKSVSDAKTVYLLLGPWEISK